MTALARDGFPNHFGDQRFGHTNRDKAQRWVERGQLPKKHDERAQVLSTLRADAYNAQLDARLAAATLRAPQPGDRAMLAGSNSHFTIEAVDDALLARLASGDIALGGWLPGKEKAPLPPAVTAWLEAADATQQVAVRYLEKYADGGWRALTVRPRDLQYHWPDAHTLHLAFTLPRGSYATALLASLFDLHDASSANSPSDIPFRPQNP